MNQKRGFSFIELLIVIAIVASLAAIISVNGTSIFKSSRETAALAHVQTLQKAQTQYYSVKRRFAPSLQDLGPAGAAVIPEHLASGKLGGYLFEVTGTDESFTVKAMPEHYGKSGETSYYTDDSLVIRSSTQAAANRDSSPVK